MSHRTQADAKGVWRSGAARPRVCVAVISGDGTSLTYRLEVLGHDVIQARSGRRALELPADSIDVYLIENTLPDMSGANVGELLRMDPLRTRAWIFGVGAYPSQDSSVSHDTIAFDDVVGATDERALRDLIERARRPRLSTSN